jgi:hypothetical protein
MADDYKVEATLDLKTSNARKNAKQAALVFDDLGKRTEWLGREFLKGSGKARRLGAQLGSGNKRLGQFGQTAAKVNKQLDRFAKNAEKSAKSTRGIGDRGPAALNRAASAAGRLGSRIRSAAAFSGHLLAKLIAIGGAYITIRSLTNAARGFVGETIRANSEMQDMLVSLGTLRASIDNMTFDEALSSSTALQRRLNLIAAQSPATGTQLTSIFTGVYGPLRRAGTGMQDLLTFTRNAASVGRVLGVDYQQLSRDVSMMATGVAGTDVKTFRLLRSMGLLTQTTQEWNRMALTDPARAARELIRAFNELGGPAAEAFGRTWTGVSSTFRGLIEHFMRIFTGPTFEKLTKRLGEINRFLLNNRKHIEALLGTYGRLVAEGFDQVVGRLQRLFDYAITNMDRIAATIDRAISGTRRLMPHIARIAKNLALFFIVARVLGPLLGAVGAIGSMLSGLAGVGGMLGIGGGGAAAAAGGGAAAAGGGAVAALGAILLPVIGIAAGALMVFVGVLTTAYFTVTRWGNQIMKVIQPLMPALTALGGVFWELGSIVFSLMDHVFSFIGISLMQSLWPSIMSVANIFMALLPYIRQFLYILRTNVAALGRVVERTAQRTFDFMSNVNRATGALRFFTSFLQRMGMPGIGAAPGGGVPTAGGPVSGFMAEARGWVRQAEKTMGALGVDDEGRPTTGRPPPGRGGTNIDMRHSRINVRQDLRGEDPDRIMVAMMDDVARQSVQRTTSPFTPALVRG